MLHFIRKNRRLLVLWLLPMFALAWLSFTCSNCADSILEQYSGSSNVLVSSLSSHHCCTDMVDTNEQDTGMSCEIACAEVAKFSISSEIDAIAADEYRINLAIPSKQYYLYVQFDVNTRLDPDNLIAHFNPDLPEKNRTLLI